MTDELFKQIIEQRFWIDPYGYVMVFQFLTLFDFLTFLLGVILGVAFGRGILTWL